MAAGAVFANASTRPAVSLSRYLMSFLQNFGFDSLAVRWQETGMRLARKFRVFANRNICCRCMLVCLIRA
jgi:hypothetical protein